MEKKEEKKRKVKRRNRVLRKRSVNESDQGKRGTLSLLASAIDHRRRCARTVAISLLCRCKLIFLRDLSVQICMPRRLLCCRCCPLSFSHRERRSLLLDPCDRSPSQNHPVASPRWLLLLPLSRVIFLVTGPCHYCWFRPSQMPLYAWPSSRARPSPSHGRRPSSKNPMRPPSPFLSLCSVFAQIRDLNLV